MSVAECPYCNADVEICHDDGYGYEEDRPHSQYCDSCGKTFAYFTSIHFSYETKKAACLNNGPHKYRKRKQYGSDGVREFKQCDLCEHRTKPVPVISQPPQAGGEGTP